MCRSLCVLILMIFMCSCVVTSKTRGTTAFSGDTVPASIAVLPVQLLETATHAQSVDSVDEDFVLGVVRSSAHNLLAGRGFVVVASELVDLKLAELNSGSDWRDLPPQELCTALGVDGLAFVDVRQWSIVRAAVVENYLLDASVTLKNKGGHTIGVWSDLAEKKSVSIPTSWESVAATLLAAYLGDSAHKQFHYVAFSWAEKVAGAIPAPLREMAVPQIFSVETNVDRRFFGIGDAIEATVRVDGDVRCYLNIGRKYANIPLRMVGPGEYQGRYVVQRGDSVQNAAVELRVVKVGGGERFWREGGSSVTILGERPRRPKEVRLQARNDGINIAWKAPSGEAVVGFVIERSNQSAGRYEDIGFVRDSAYADPEVVQGEGYHYRIRSIDRAGNRSKVVRTYPVQMPYFQPRDIAGEISGILVPGNYTASGDLTVAAGEVLTLQSGTRVFFGKESSLVVLGGLVVEGTPESPVVIAGEGWKGIVIADGASASLRHAQIRDAQIGMQLNGTATIRNMKLVGNGAGVGVRIETETFCRLEEVNVSGWETGVQFIKGAGEIANSKMSQCGLALDFMRGDLSFHQNSLDHNRLNVRAKETLVIEDNYLNAIDAPMGVVDAVIVQSRRDAPPPHGRLFVLQESTPLSAAEVDSLFDEAVRQGETALSQKQYGAALGYFNKALRYKQSRAVYLSLSAIRSILGENDEVERILVQGLETFPYDVRMHEVYIKHLIDWGRYGDAAERTEKALRLAPKDASLVFIKEYLEAVMRKVS